ncbi:hypothetical protein H6G93_09345 [Nostoc sp. FACHB-973]|nr:hypothetical protein [Nostoc sp. FACHB-973]
MPQEYIKGDTEILVELRYVKSYPKIRCLSFDEVVPNSGYDYDALAIIADEHLIQIDTEVHTIIAKNINWKIINREDADAPYGKATKFYLKNIGGE